jgi:hypothetical protein
LGFENSHPGPVREFIFFYIFSLSILQNYMVRPKNYTSSATRPTALGSKKMQNYTSSAMGPTAVPHCGSGPVYFKKIVIFCLNSDGGKHYMKIVAFDEIYNFIVQSFHLKSSS